MFSKLYTSIHLSSGWPPHSHMSTLRGKQGWEVDSGWVPRAQLRRWERGKEKIIGATNRSATQPEGGT